MVVGKKTSAVFTSEISKEHTNTFLLITFLIFNGFSIQKKFWKAKT